MTARRLMAWATALLVAAAVAVAGCGDDTAGTGGDPPAAPPAADGVEHVHAVGVDPGDGAIILATHTGLFRLAPDETAPARVGDLRQDTMGFTVTGPGRYLGSGHPDPRTDLPAHLGLIASDDGGRTWDAVSLSGEADFHVLRARGARVVGVDSRTGRVFRSTDAGRTWTGAAPPAGLVDLAVHPARAGTYVAATRGGLIGSRDAGATWRPLTGAPGYLAWPAGGALYRVTADGAVTVSGDGGRSWAMRATTGAAPAAVAAPTDAHLVVVTHDGRVLESRDGARSWGIRAELG